MPGALIISNAGGALAARALPHHDGAVRANGTARDHAAVSMGASPIAATIVVAMIVVTMVMAIGPTRARLRLDLRYAPAPRRA